MFTSTPSCLRPEPMFAPMPYRLRLSDPGIVLSSAWICTASGQGQREDGFDFHETFDRELYLWMSRQPFDRRGLLLRTSDRRFPHPFADITSMKVCCPRRSIGAWSLARRRRIPPRRRSPSRSAQWRCGRGRTGHGIFLRARVHLPSARRTARHSPPAGAMCAMERAPTITAWFSSGQRAATAEAPRSAMTPKVVATPRARPRRVVGMSACRRRAD